MRVFLYAAVLMIAAILSCTMLMLNPLIGIVLLFGIVVLPIVFACYYYHVGDKARVSCWVVSSICIVASIVGFFGRIVYWQGSSIQGDHRVSGTIVRVSNYNDSNYISVTLGNLYIDSTHVSGQMRVNISIRDDKSDLHFANVGDELRFEGYVTTYDILQDKFDIDRLTSGVQYLCRIVDTNAQAIHIPRATTGMALVRLQLSDILDKFLSPSNASVARAMLIGDRTDMDADGNSIFVNTGFVHILSVSGAHISILAAVLGWILLKLKCKRIVASGITMVVVLIYAWLSSFEIPVIRAAIMFGVYSVASLRGKWYDTLNSLGFAACVLLLYNPFFVFSVSFVLSFGAVLSIVLFYKSIHISLYNFVNKIMSRKYALTTMNANCTFVTNASSVAILATTSTSRVATPPNNTKSIYLTNPRPLDKLLLKVSDKLSKAIALVLSVQVISIALTALTIGRIATYSAILNLVFKPLVDVIFILMMLLVPLTMIIPLIGYGLIGLDWLLNIFMYVLHWAADLPYSNIFVWPWLPLVLALIVALVLTSRFLLSNRVRVLAGIASLIMYIGVFAIGLPYNSVRNGVVPMSNNQTIVTSLDTTMYFGSIGSRASESYNILDFRITRIDVLFVTDDSFVNAKALRAIRRTFGVRTFYVPITMSVGDIVAMRQEGLHVEILDSNLVDWGEFSIGAIVTDGIFMGYQLFGSVNILISGQNVSLSKFGEEMLYNFDILRSSHTIPYYQAVQIVDNSFFEVDTELVLVSYDMPLSWFDYVDYKIKN